MDRSLEVLSLTKEDLANWHRDPITRLVLSKISELIKESLLSLGDGGILSADRTDITAQNYAKVVGYIAGLRVVLNIEVPDGENETDGITSDRE